MSGSADVVRPGARPLSVLDRFGTFAHAVFFMLGFTTIFVLVFGLPLYAVGQVLGDYKPLLALAGAALVIVFGLATMGVFQIAWLNYDTRKQWAGRRDWGFLSSYLMGFFFAAGWSPCIGTTLGAILTMAYNQTTVTQGVVLLLAYSLGLGVPFLMVGLGIDRAARGLRRVQRYMGAFKIVTGLLLIGVGLLVLFDALPAALALFGAYFRWPFWVPSLTSIATLALQQGWYLDPAGQGAAAPTVLLSFAAGLLSFLSPCVLPLVPAYVSYLSGRAVVQAAPGA